MQGSLYGWWVVKNPILTQGNKERMTYESQRGAPKLPSSLAAGAGNMRIKTASY
jgi:hypothetical protein